MKKVFLVLLVLVSIFSSAQDVKRHAPFVFAGVGFTPSQDLSYSAEVGTWGTLSPTSFSLTFDAVQNIANGVSNEFAYWVGVKPYFTVGEKEKLVYMVYFAPKVQVNGNKNYLVEVGFNPNYTVGRNVLLGLTVGNQSLNGSPLNPFVAAGFVLLLRK